MPATTQDVLTARKSAALTGTMPIPGDKSMSHRALIFGTLAIGTTRVTGLLESADVMSTKDALIALGAAISRDKNGIWHVTGVGLNGMISPATPLDLGNSGTAARLLMGVVAGQDISATFTGDASLSMRPMARITHPLMDMGAQITSRDGGLLPVTIKGSKTPLAITYHSKVASAQVKSAILLAGLNARGITRVIEPHASRDHSESMLRHFGADVSQQVDTDLSHHVTLVGEASLSAADIAVPADPSSAAFAIVAALITPGSDIRLIGIGMNPLRIGLLTTLIEMGADIQRLNDRIESGEPVADLRVRHSPLRAVTVPANRAASMIDEYPILSVAAATATGTTKMRGIAELRVKETDRIKVMADGLRACGVTVDYDDDSMQVTGGPSIAGGAHLSAQHDHRIAMSFLTLGLVASAPITVTGCQTIETSFPGFAAGLNGLGATITGSQIS